MNVIAFEISKERSYKQNETVLKHIDNIDSHKKVKVNCMFGIVLSLFIKLKNTIVAFLFFFFSIKCNTFRKAW